MSLSTMATAAGVWVINCPSCSSRMVWTRSNSVNRRARRNSSVTISARPLSSRISMSLGVRSPGPYTHSAPATCPSGV